MKLIWLFILLILSTPIWANVQETKNVGLVLDPKVESRGVKVLAVTPGSVADLLGVQAGNHISAVNGISIDSDNAKAQIQQLVFAKPNDVIAFRYVAEGREIEMLTVLIESLKACDVAYLKSIKNALSGQDLYRVGMSYFNREPRLQKSWRYRVDAGFLPLRMSEAIFQRDISSNDRGVRDSIPMQVNTSKRKRNKREYKDVIMYLPAGFEYSVASKYLKQYRTKQFHSRYWYPTIHSFKKISDCS